VPEVADHTAAVSVCLSGEAQMQSMMTFGSDNASADCTAYASVALLILGTLMQAIASERAESRKIR